MPKVLYLIVSLFAFTICKANEEDSLAASLRYQTGQVQLSNGIAQINVPKGFKYLDQKQSAYVLTEVWGNPPQPDVVGMLFPEKGDPFIDSSYAFVITYEEMGFVKDEDADKIDYTELLKDIQSSEAEDNKKRKEMGYTSIHMVGWASQPYYDKTNKVLHWAKELQFGDRDAHTLNYNIVLLGRKGVLTMNAVGDMYQLSLVKNDINKVLHMASFNAGNKHSDFKPDVDKVAAWTIGGLVAGKVLAKVGVLAFFGKFIKIILLALAGAGAWITKLIRGKKAGKVAGPDNVI